MKVSLEYILAALMIFLIFASVQISIFNIVTHSLTGLEQSEEYRKAVNILDSILLSPGGPQDWWNCTKYPDPENISHIGFAPQSSIDEYALDIRKINRLNSKSEGYISPPVFRSLIGLSNYYDFSLRISPFFKISGSNISGIFNIVVKNLNGLGQPNVKITAFYVPLSFDPSVEYISNSSITGIDGTCTLSFTYNPGYRLVVCANQVGVKAIASFPENLGLRVYGDLVYETNIPLVSYLEYETSSTYGLIEEEVASRYITIDGITYYIELSLWS